MHRSHGALTILHAHMSAHTNMHTHTLSLVRYGVIYDVIHGVTYGLIHDVIYGVYIWCLFLVFIYGVIHGVI